MALVNGSFRDGATGWIFGSGLSYDSAYGFDDNQSARWTGFGISRLEQSEFSAVYPGQSISAECMIQQGASSRGTAGAAAVIVWYDEDELEISYQEGNYVIDGSGGAWHKSSVTATAPAGAAFARFAVFTFRNSGSFPLWIDVASWNYVFSTEIELVIPLDGQIFTTDDNIAFRVEVTGTTPPVDNVEYLANGVSFGSVDDAPYALNYDALAAGTYTIQARANLVGGLEVLSNEIEITVNTVAPPVITREFKASNAYTYLVGENFGGLASSIPSTALVVGVELELDYDLSALIRAKDFDIPAESSTANVLFDIVNNTTIEAILLEKNGTSYTQIGSPMTAAAPLIRSDFTVAEDGTSEGKRWTVMNAGGFSQTLGAEDQLFASDPIGLTDFLETAVGIRFYPVLGSKPAYADSGDAVIRFLLDKLRMKVYFDAGSVEYYFVSPDGTQIIKGRLAAAYVDAGNFQNGDASGVLQLTPDLEVITGTSRTILVGWTIHSAYPPSDANQIGVVAANMAYNGLPTYWQVEDNRSRYQFISANFYGDLTYDSIYGVNGVDRAFSYNGDFFYKIHTQPEAAKDKPRHVEFYHTHLALGYAEGRVDVSVVGEPYNFSGTDGASSWAIGDSVTGLLNLSGTMLAIFCRKSIHALAGTTVDNFSTQVLSPKIGAVEYTVTDMGFPVYANAYGIYTLSQTNQYGDYLGTPMSQDVSPWLRPRLVRKITSPREVVVAWPVRAKNQYKLAFGDGYTLTMTMNNGTQQTPTFSKQKYFLGQEDFGGTLYEYPAIVPSAISSELDDGGEERIHVASKQSTYREVEILDPTPPEFTGEPEGGQRCVPFAFSPSVSGYGPISVTVADGTLPPGLDLSEYTAEITGTPTNWGVYPVTFLATDGNGLTTELTVTFNIANVSWDYVTWDGPYAQVFTNPGRPAVVEPNTILLPVPDSSGVGGRYRSTDGGVTFTKLGSGWYLGGVAVNPETGRVMFARTPGVMEWSDDAGTTVTAASGDSISVEGLVFQNGGFYAVGGNRYAYGGADGEHWVNGPLDIAASVFFAWSDVLEKWVRLSAGPPSLVQTSDDLLNGPWATVATIPTSGFNQLGGFKIIRDVFYASTQGGQIWRSTDAVNWTLVHTLLGTIKGDISLLPDVGPTGSLISHGTGAAKISVSQDNGETWTDYAAPFGGGYGVYVEGISTYVNIRHLGTSVADIIDACEIE